LCEGEPARPNWTGSKIRLSKLSEHTINSSILERCSYNIFHR
jgi:hypothetical protein